MRLDTYLTKTNQSPSREKAKRDITKGYIKVNESVQTTPSYLMKKGDRITVLGQSSSYVGIGGDKLEAAIRTFLISLKGETVVDAGSSTGGFTQCLLRYGASKVYAVDVGTGQLASILREDPRVMVMEQTDLRSLSEKSFQEPIRWMTVDLSFISVTKILGQIYGILAADGQALVLVKPQFEAGKGQVGKSGVVSSRETHVRVLVNVTETARDQGFAIRGLCPCPIHGKEGNVEYFIHLSKGGISVSFDIVETVKQAFSMGA